MFSKHFVNIKCCTNSNNNIKFYLISSLRTQSGAGRLLMKSAESSKLGTVDNSVLGQANTQGMLRTMNKPLGSQVWSLPQLSTHPTKGLSYGSQPAPGGNHTELSPCTSPHHPCNVYPGKMELKWTLGSKGREECESCLGVNPRHGSVEKVLGTSWWWRVTVRECDAVTLLGSLWEVNNVPPTSWASTLRFQDTTPSLAFCLQREKVQHSEPKSGSVWVPGPRHQTSALRAQGYVFKVTQISLRQNPNSSSWLTRLFMTQPFLTFPSLPLTTHRWFSSHPEPCPPPWPYALALPSARNTLLFPPCPTKLTFGSQFSHNRTEYSSSGYPWHLILFSS